MSPSNLNSTNLRDKSLTKDDILEQLQAGENNNILKDISKVLNLQGYFIMDMDKNGYVIYANIHPDSHDFDYDSGRYDGVNCLTSSELR